jgi:hypothetical protein
MLILVFDSVFFCNQAQVCIVGQQGIMFHFILSADKGMRRHQIDRANFNEEKMLLFVMQNRRHCCSLNWQQHKCISDLGGKFIFKN